jgi:WD repeat-containing protein 19
MLEIAIVCENMKQLMEAAQLYEKAGLPEKAASIYIGLKLFKQATPLIGKIKSPKLLQQLAKVDFSLFWSIIFFLG